VIKSLSLGLNHETQPEQTLCERFESNVIFTQLIFCHLSHLKITIERLIVINSKLQYGFLHLANRKGSSLMK